MALDDLAVLIAGTGAIWTGTVGTATKPTLSQLNTFASAGTMPSGWTNIGHTSQDDLPAPGRDGGDVTTKPTWQAPGGLRSTVEATTDYWDVKSLQIQDNQILSYYYGGGTFAAANEFVLPGAPAPVEKAVVFVINDGGVPIAQWNPKMSIFGVDEIELDIEEFSVVPLRFTRLGLAGQPPAVWIGAKFGTTP